MIAVSSTAITRKVAAATEWTACRLALQPQLGPPRFELLGWRIYHPSAFFCWWFAYDAYTREVFVDCARLNDDWFGLRRANPLRRSRRARQARSVP